MRPKLSTIICTYTRTHRLIECLKSIEKQTLPPDQFEVVVVTRLLKPEHEKNLNNFIRHTNLNIIIVHLSPDCLGCSRARNAGLAKSKGEIIHFLDDDTLVSAGCLQSYVNLFNSTDAMCSGGKIIPKFITSPPNWMKPPLWHLLGVLDLGEKIREFNYPSNFPVGANMAFRREVFDRYGIFDPDFGVLGNIGIDADETDICYKIQRDGKRLLYCPDALAYHCIEEDKMNWRWMIRRAYTAGKGSAMVQLKHNSAFQVFMFGLKSLIRKKEPDTSLNNIKMPLHALSYHLQTRFAMMLGYGIAILKAAMK